MQQGVGTATYCQSAVKSARWETTSSSPQGKALDGNRCGEREKKRAGVRGKKKKGIKRIRGADGGPDMLVAAVTAPGEPRMAGKET